MLYNCNVYIHRYAGRIAQQEKHALHAKSKVVPKDELGDVFVTEKDSEEEEEEEEEEEDDEDE
jgi:hypothetical protein